jgi:hypothetical protein
MHDKIKAIAATYQEAKGQIQTEEATKNALVMPFIAALGYNVFNPLEVIPEFDAGVAGRKDQKADYAIKINDSIAILIECKMAGSPLNKVKVSQLFHYFAACKAHLAILTDGLEYHFFADTEESNLMDETPFFSFNILNFDESQLLELGRFTKSTFNLDGIISKAAEMKRIAAVGVLLGKYMAEPSENFVKSVLADLNFQGIKTQQVIAAYTQTIKDAFSKFVKDKVSHVLRDALKQNQGGLEGMENIIAMSPVPPVDAQAEAEKDDDGIVTTPEEIEAYAAIKSIAREIIPASRVFMRDAKSYCAILLDNKNYKPIVRLYFNNPANKRLNIFAGPQDKKGEMFPIGQLDEVYHYADKIRAAIKSYDEAPTPDKSMDDPPTGGEGAGGDA